MLYPFMTLEDQTEIVHSDLYVEDEREHVLVEIEKPINGGFKSAQYVIPDYVWKNNTGFQPDEIARLEEFLASVSHIIIQLARDGGFENASSF